MPTGTVTEPRRVAKKKPVKPAQPPIPAEPLTGGRIELQAPPEWIARLDAAAAKLGMSRSAYIRMACNRQMNLDEKNG